LEEKRPKLRQEEVLLLHDNARPHTANLTKATLKKLKWEVLPQPPYSPDMSPSDFFLFRSMKSKMRGQSFKSDEEVAKWLDEFFGSRPVGFFDDGITQLMGRWEDIIEYEGHYAVE